MHVCGPQILCRKKLTWRGETRRWRCLFFLPTILKKEFSNLSVYLCSPVQPSGPFFVAAGAHRPQGRESCCPRFQFSPRRQYLQSCIGRPVAISSVKETASNRARAEKHKRTVLLCCVFEWFQSTLCLGDNMGLSLGSSMDHFSHTSYSCTIPSSPMTININQHACI